MSSETLRKEVASLGFYLNKENYTLYKNYESVIVGLHTLRKVILAEKKEYLSRRVK